MRSVSSSKNFQMEKDKLIQDHRKLIEEPFETLRIADEIRREVVGDVVTFVVNRNINFTDICINRCRFCSFRNRKGFLLSLEEIKRKVEEALDYGCTEVCIQGGIHPNAGLSFYLSILDAVREVSEDIHIHAFSPMEIYNAARESGMDVKEVLRELKKSGLNSIPGTAAEILDDRIREIICPEKITTKQWVDVITEAHKMGIPTTATMMYGHIEDWEHRVKHLLIIKQIQRRTSGFTEFIPLPFMWRNNELGRIVRGSSGFEDLLVIAISRIILYPEIKNIQASWVKMGLKLSQAALNVGANDLGGTLMEVNISKAAGATSGEFLRVEELKAMIETAGRIAKQRDTLYRIIE